MCLKTLLGHWLYKSSFKQESCLRWLLEANIQSVKNWKVSYKKLYWLLLINNYSFIFRRNWNQLLYSCWTISWFCIISLSVLARAKDNRLAVLILHSRFRMLLTAVGIETFAQDDHENQNVSLDIHTINRRLITRCPRVQLNECGFAF